MHKNDFYNLSKIFKMYDNIKDLYEAFQKLIQENNYKIENKNNEIKLIFSIGDMFKKNNDIELILYKSNENNDFLRILSKEIIKIKNEEIKELKENNETMEQAIKDLKNENKSLIKEMAKLNKNEKKLYNVIVKCEENNVNLHETIKSLKKEIKQLKEEMKRLNIHSSEIEKKSEDKGKNDIEIKKPELNEITQNESIKEKIDSTLILDNPNSKDLKYLTVFAFDTLISHLRKKLIKNRFPESLKSKRFPLFVTWKNRSNLRGCIGNFSAENLEKNLKYYSLESALKDRRFPPIEEKEIENLYCEINLLTDFETAKDCYDWELGKHGIKIKFDKYCYTFLPQVPLEHKMNKKEALESLIENAGYNGSLKSVEKKMETIRFQSTLLCMNYDEYKNY